MTDQKDRDTPEVSRRFEIVGTGQGLPVWADYIDTVFIDEYVWHVFDMGER